MMNIHNLLNIRYIPIGGGNFQSPLNTEFVDNNRRRWSMSSCGAWATAFFVSTGKFLFVLTLMLSVLFLTGCEKIDMNDQIMQSFFASACQLNENSDPEEVQLLGQEFETTTNRNEELKQHRLYNPTRQHLESAGYEFKVGINITINDEWAGNIEYKY